MICENKLKKTLKNPYVFQYLQLLTSTALMMAFQFVFTMLLTKNLSTEDFADYKQIINTLMLFQSLFLFGWPFTISYLMAKCGDEEQKIRKYIGAGLKFIIMVVAVLYIAVLALCMLQSLFNFKIVPFYWIFAFPITIVPFLQYYLEYVCMGTNKIKFLSIEKFGTQLFAVLMLSVTVFLVPHLKMKHAILVYGISHLSILLFIFFKFHPKLRKTENEAIEIKETNRRVGLPTYIGGLCSVGSVRLVAVIVAAFTTREEYAYFALAVTISAPLGPVISSLGSILYKKFSLEGEIDKSFIRLITVTVVLIATVYVVGIKIFTPILFGEKYKSSILFAQLMGVGSLLVGFADVFNRFLGSKGEGKAIQHGAMATGIANIIVSISLLPIIGALGACLAQVVSDITYLLFMIFKYKKFVKVNGEDLV